MTHWAAPCTRTSHASAKSWPTDDDVRIDWLWLVDVRVLPALENSICDFGQDLLIHMPALTDLEHCERNFDDSLRTDALRAENAALSASCLGISAVQVLAAGIVDHACMFCSDIDQSGLLGTRARSRCYADANVQRVNPKQIAFRAYGMI